MSFYWITPFVILIFLAYFFRVGFLLNDVTTTPENPPSSAQTGQMSDNVREQNKYFHNYLTPLKLSIPFDEAYSLVLNQAKETKNWDITSENAQQGTIEAVATTPLMHFKDDIVIEVRQENGYSTVHIRSKSRVGKGDLGANARRIQQFLSELNEKEQHSRSSTP